VTHSGWNISDPVQVLSLIGSMLILIAYAITVRRPSRRRLYCTISLGGGALLLIVALVYRNLGLTLLEIVWISINLWGLWDSRRVTGAG
jgi:hypothetical protein